MNPPLDLTVTVDNSGGDPIDAAARFRDRTLNVFFDLRPPTLGCVEGSFQATAFGDAIDDGGGAWTGWTTYGRNEAYAAINQLRSTWQRRVIEYRVGGRYPFSAGWDLSGPADRGHLDAVGLDLARAGRRLFTFLFRTGDEQLREIADLLEVALRHGDQLIEIHSDQLFAPWWMLYTPPDPQTNLFDDDRKMELARAIQAADFPDKLIYFACHGRVTGGDGTAAGQASLTLSDDDPILTTDFVEWFDNQPLSTNPVVFIGACQGGQMSSLFYGACGLELLKAGANCVIGPQVDLPVPFAARYADELFTRFLAGNCRLGDAVRELTRCCARDRHNPEIALR